MEEMQIRLQAALNEQKYIADLLMQRCMNLAAELAVVNKKPLEPSSSSTGA